MEFEIIDFVKGNPILYQRKYNTNKCKPLKMEKWIELGRTLKRDPNSLRLRWKGMRDNYRKQMLAKSKEQRDGEDVLGSTGVSKYYNHMTFLNTEYQEEDDSDQDTSSNAAEQDAYVEQVSYEIEPLDIKPADIENFDLNQYLKQHDAKLIDPSQITASTVNMMTEEANLLTKKKRVNKDDIITEACEEMSALLQSAKQQFVPPTHNQIFFNSVALQVEQAEMPAMDLMRLQQKILELITQELVMHQERTYELQ